ncbi:MAG TPA: UDP-glucose 4-epimerase GalE [Segeticoccus sp.]|nr:UDP-glucose 4-epimerase GalE [Segeticoccus sp.]
MRVLVSGGAGYIGSHTVVRLVAAGHDVVIVDNFSNAKPAVVGRLEAITGTHLPVHGFDLRDADKTEHLFAHEQIDAVIHFAGFKAVGESVAKPLEYYENNLGSTFSLVRAMQRHGVDKLVFSSSATVYGTDQEAATEDRPTSATNPYGWTKVMQEQVLRDVAAAQENWRIALLRYFNPVGAHESGTIGEDPSDIPNNLMPFIAQVAIGRREKLRVFGDDYDTVDGTGVRDYIHVEDLAAGHVAALDKLTRTDEPVSTWNLGTGRGTSVLQLLRAFEKAVGRELPHEVVGRRPGDIATSYADPSRAHAELGWRAMKSVEDMCADAWRWQSQNPNGYRDA